MSTFAEYTNKKKKKKDIENMSFKDYTSSVLGISFADIAPIGKDKEERKAEEDIAPVKGGGSRRENGTTTLSENNAKERTWFQSGALENRFEDGWQVGDVTKTIGDIGRTILGSKTDLATNVSAGVMGMGEKAVDLLAYLAPAFTASQQAQNNPYYQFDIKEYRQQQQDMSEFMQKDLYDEQEIAKKIISDPYKKMTGIDSETASVFGEKSDALAQSAGQLGATVALQAVGVPWWLTTGATSFGGEAESALKEGATYEQAGASALITAGADILTEKISGGIKFGGKTLDDGLTKALARTISDKTLRTLTKLGVDATGEGLEEVVAGVFSNLGTSLYKEENAWELVSNEEALDEYIESFVGGAVLGGGMGGINAVRSNSKGVDYVTEMTENEQKVHDAEVKRRTEEAEKAKGEKLTGKEKKAIYEEVTEDLESGNIDTSNIESVLGGETYENYNSIVEQEKAINEEIEALENKVENTFTHKDSERLTELREQLKTIDKQSVQERLTAEVEEMTRADRLHESYNERSRKGQAFEADLTQYAEGVQRDTVKSAIESGILNNTNRTHKFVDLIAKLSADKGVLFDFADNAKLKETGFVVEGRTINGYVQDGKITLNINSNKALNTVVGHEITHVLEGTELYTELQNVVEQYMETKSKGEYASRLKALAKTYENVESVKTEADLKRELTADLVGEYLFTDKNFISNLSTEKPGLFKWLLGEVKYFAKIATAGSKEARELEKLKRTFEQVYKETSKAKTEGTKLSLSTERESLPKTRNTMNPTGANLQKDAKTVREVRNETMLKNGYTEADVKQVNEFMDNIATFMEKAGVTYKFIGLDDVNNAKLKVVYDRNGNPKRVTMSAMVKNGDYPVNFDFTSICKKRQSMSMVIKELASRKQADGSRTLDTIDLDAKSLWTINEELRKAGLETACLGCFVESKRYNIQNFADKATSMWNSIVDEVRSKQGQTGPAENFNFASGIDLDSVDFEKVDSAFKAYSTVPGRTSPEARMRALIENGGELYQKYLQPSDLMTPEGIEALKSLSTKKNNFYGIIQGVYGQASPKEVMGFSPYNSEVALLPNKRGKQTMAEYVASIGGVRMQSFSDFVIANVYDYMQMVADLSARHLPAHAYTKEIAFAKIFGMTGIKINMSVMFDIDPTLPDEYAGLTFVQDKNGNEVYNGQRGRFEYLVGDKKRSDSVYEKTGERPYVQSIGFDEAVELQNTEGYSGNIGIIGVGYSDKHIVKMLSDNNIRYVIPYHSSSLPSVIKSVTNIAKAKDYTDFQNTRVEASGEKLVGLGGFDIYKDVEATQNPKATAQNYLDYCRENGYIPVFDDFAWHENYYKLLFDFDPYDTITGEYSPQTEVKPVYKGYNPSLGLTSTSEVERIIDEEMKTQNEANRQRNEKIPSVVDSVLEQIGLENNKVDFSLSDASQDIAPTGNYRVYGKDIALEAPVTETVAETEVVDDYAPLTEEMANERDAQQGDRLYSLDDADAPQEVEEAPYFESEPVEPADPFSERDIQDVGKRDVKAYMYENPEVRPYFQEEAKIMLRELQDSIKGERIVNADLLYETGGEFGVWGTKRETSEQIAYLLDRFKYTYAEIRKGLEAIIEDHGAENIAVAKRLEFMIDERLRDGYTDFTSGMDIPANQEYLTLMQEKQISDYSDEAFEMWARSLSDEHAPAEDIAPVREDIITTNERQQVMDFEKGEIVDEEESENKTYHKSRKELKRALIEGEKNFFTQAMDEAKNLPTLLLNNTDTIRVTEMVFGRQNGKVINETIFQTAIDNEAKSVAWQNKERSEIKALGIKPRSKESSAVQKYGEKQYENADGVMVPYGDAELAKEFPDVETQRKIKHASKVLRQKYDTYIDEANAVLTELGFKPIAKRPDYMRHFEALTDAFSRIGIPFNIQQMKEHDLPTDINGLTDAFVPQKNFFANAMHRTGNKTTFDAITGIDGYIGGIANLIHHTEDVQRGRAFEDLIRENYGLRDSEKVLEAITDEHARNIRREQMANNHLSGYASWVHDWTDNLAGKKDVADRGFERRGGRRLFAFFDTVRQQTGSNMVGGNISSSLTNLIAPVKALAKTNKIAYTKGLVDTFRNIIVKDDFMDKNSFLTARMGTDKLSKNLWEHTRDAGFIFMKGVDYFSSNLVVRAKYNELISKGMSEEQAHKEAGQFASRIMGDRTKGANPQLYNSKFFNMVAQFQLEVNNDLYSMFYDTYHESKEKANGNALKTAVGMTFTLGQLFAFTHLFSVGFQSIAGYSPTLDIIDVIKTALGMGDDDEEEEKPLGDRMEEATMKLLKGLPYISMFVDGGRIPMSSALPISQFISGKDDYGNEKSRLETFTEALPYYLMPTGYGQIKKSIAGLKMFDEELPVTGSYTDSGNLRFPIEDTPLNRIQAGVFGQWANKNARDYFNNERQPLKEKQIEEYAELDIPIADYWKYREGLADQKTLEDKFDYIADLDLPVEKKNIMINNIVDRKEEVDLTNYDDFENYEEFDFAVKHPEKYPVVKAVGGYENYKKYNETLSDITADKDKNGKTISGSRKQKVADYINDLNAEYGEKIILFKSEYPADDRYNQDIIDYLNGREDITYSDMEGILKALGFTVEADGTVRW